jgi:enterochelin esterase family protein
VSTRVHDLALALQAGDQTELLRAFVGENGFPLVNGDQVTFFYWDGGPVDEVLLIHWVYGLESRRQFQRIPGTDAFFLTMQLPLRSRIEYKLEVVRAGRHDWIRDPLNPRLAHDPFGANSVCPMPGYAPPTWRRREPWVKRGRLEDVVVPSTVYGGERFAKVYLPHEYREGRRYPLLVVHDGLDYLAYARMDEILDGLIHRHEVMPLVAVFTPGVARNEEYAANPKQVAFLVDELLPFVTERYAVTDDPVDRGLMGASFGGVSSLFTAWSRPGVFRQLLLQSGSFVFTEVGHHGRPPIWDPIVGFVNELREDPSRIDARIFMSCGTFESLISYNRSLVPLLRGAGVPLRFVEARDGHNWVAWRDRLRDGLTYLFPGRLRMVYE